MSRFAYVSSNSDYLDMSLRNRLHGSFKEEEPTYPLDLERFAYVFI